MHAFSKLRKLDDGRHSPVEMINLLLVLDIWVPGMSLGDIDDLLLAATAHLMNDKVSLKIYLVNNEARLAAMRGQQDLAGYFSEGTFIEGKFTAEHLAWATKVLVCAPMDDPEAVALMTADSAANPGKYGCQGADDKAYNIKGEALQAMANTFVSRYPTNKTNISFDKSILTKLRFEDSVINMCLSYTFRKLVSPGAVLGIVARLYCPLVAGGPGGNMLTIQRHLNTVFFDNKLSVTAESFHATNESIHAFVKANRLALEEDVRFRFSYEAIDLFLADVDPVVDQLAAANPTIAELPLAMRVVRLYANLFYVPHAGFAPLYAPDTPFFALDNLPDGALHHSIETQLTTVVGYDLVAGWAFLNDITADDLVNMSEEEIRCAVLNFIPGWDKAKLDGMPDDVFLLMTKENFPSIDYAGKTIAELRETVLQSLA
jgi:hypothetical protein